ncbi:MAG: glycosyltransferase family 39 protein [Lachnospiraceae bacterium]|nr:glycosyltransferase family 39 protein [Lachnospiraceae bacterium]
MLGASAKENRKYDILIPMVAFVSMVIFKIIFVIGNRTIPTLADEFIYIEYARQLAENGFYSGVHYPLMYPLLLSPAFLFGDNFYIVMKIINVLWSSMAPVLVYFIARKFVGYKESAICTAFCMVLPFQYTFPMMMLSENVYYPLLLLAVLILVSDIKNEWLEVIGLGVLLGIMFMTRHVTLVMLPVFWMAWVLKKFSQKAKFSTILTQGMALVLSCLVAYMPWFIMQLRNGYRVKVIIGFSIASKTNPEQLTADRLLMVALFYLCYLAVILAPVLGIMIKSLFAIEWKKPWSQYNRLFFLIWGLLGINFVAVVRHSWRANYNYPVFERIKGRYVLYFPILFAILAIVALYNRRVVIKNKVINILVTYLLPCAAVIVSYGIVAKGWFFNLNPTEFLGSIQAIDGIRAVQAGYKYVAVALIFSIVAQAVYDFGILKSGNLKSTIMIVGACLIVAESAGTTDGWKHIKELQANEDNGTVLYGTRLVETLEKMPYDTAGKYYVYSDNLVNFNFLKRLIRFENKNDVIFSNKVKSMEGENIYVYTKEPEKYIDYFIENIAGFEYQQEKYYLLYIKAEGIKEK